MATRNVDYKWNLQSTKRRRSLKLRKSWFFSFLLLFVYVLKNTACSLRNWNLQNVKYPYKWSERGDRVTIRRSLPDIAYFCLKLISKMVQNTKKHHFSTVVSQEVKFLVVAMCCMTPVLFSFLLPMTWLTRISDQLKFSGYMAPLKWIWKCQKRRKLVHFWALWKKTEEKQEFS